MLSPMYMWSRHGEYILKRATWSKVRRSTQASQKKKKNLEIDAAYEVCRVAGLRDARERAARDTGLDLRRRLAGGDLALGARLLEMFGVIREPTSARLGHVARAEELEACCVSLG